MSKFRRCTHQNLPFRSFSIALNKARILQINKHSTDGENGSFAWQKHANSPRNMQTRLKFEPLTSRLQSRIGSAVQKMDGCHELKHSQAYGSISELNQVLIKLSEREHGLRLMKITCQTQRGRSGLQPIVQIACRGRQLCRCSTRATRLNRPGMNTNVSRQWRRPPGASFKGQCSRGGGIGGMERVHVPARALPTQHYCCASLKREKKSAIYCIMLYKNRQE